MRESLKSLMLWQEKRNELPISDDVQAGWNQMSSLLDQHMPVVSKPGGFKGFKMLPSIFIALSVAAMIYLASAIYSSEKHKQHTKDNFHNATPTQQGSSVSDSTGIRDSIANKDSRFSAKQQATADSSVSNGSDVNKINFDRLKQNTGETKTVEGKTTANQSLAKPGVANPAIAKSPGGRGGPGSSPLSSINPSQNQGQTGNKNNPVIGNAQNGRNSAANGRHNNRPANPSSVSKSSNGAGFSGTSGNRGALPGAGGHRSNGYISPNKLPGNKINTGAYGNNTATITDDFNNRHNIPNLAMATPSFNADLFANKNNPPLIPRPVLDANVFQKAAAGKAADVKNKKDKPIKPVNTKPSKLDWGILLGANSSGSFTPKSQNSNFYGSWPFDPYFGLFATYKLNKTWAINPQVKLFSPQTIVTTYSHANQSSVDSGQSLSITSSRKVYSVNVPIYVAYNIGNGLNFKAGPVINFPVKQINATSTLLPYSIRTDTTYYKSISAILNATQYQQKINFGFSAGASYQYRRWIIEAAYLKSLTGYSISSGLGTYKSSPGIFQFTIGFQLDKLKP